MIVYRSKVGPSRGNHVPVLIKVMKITEGTILELGSGYYSTTFLHWSCYHTGRKIVTYENNPQWYKFAQSFQCDYHDIRFVEDWDKINLGEPWSMALIDHSPNERRVMEVRRLRHVPYLVIHDTERRRERQYRYLSARRFYRYKWQYIDSGLPYTSVWSNIVDLTGFNLD